VVGPGSRGSPRDGWPVACGVADRMSWPGVETFFGADDRAAELLATGYREGFLERGGATVGLEEELMLVDPGTLEPVESVAGVLAALGRPDVRGRVSLGAARARASSPAHGGRSPSMSSRPLALASCEATRGRGSRSPRPAATPRSTHRRVTELPVQLIDASTATGRHAVACLRSARARRDSTDTPTQLSPSTNSCRTVPARAGGTGR